MSRRYVMAIVMWVMIATAPSTANPNPTPTATVLPATALGPHEVYVRCIEAMQNNPNPKYLSYELKVYSNHINLTRAYDAAGYPTTTLNFRVGHQEATYLVRYRASDGRSFMLNIASRDATVGPPVPWSLDFGGFGSPSAPTTNETVSAGSVTTDLAGSLLGELSVDHGPAYRIAFAPNGTTPQSYILMLESNGGDPNAHALRELVVDPSSFRVLAATFEVGQHRFLFGGTLRLRVTFSQVGGYWLNTDGALVGQGHYAFVSFQGSYSYHASNFGFPMGLPQLLFAGSHSSSDDLHPKRSADSFRRRP